MAGAAIARGGEVRPAVIFRFVHGRLCTRVHEDPAGNGALISARTRDELLEIPLHVAARRGAYCSPRRASLVRGRSAQTFSRQTSRNLAS